jgi:hypothetical protein
MLTSNEFRANDISDSSEVLLGTGVTLNQGRCDRPALTYFLYSPFPDPIFLAISQTIMYN